MEQIDLCGTYLIAVAGYKSRGGLDEFHRLSHLKDEFSDSLYSVSVDSKDNQVLAELVERIILPSLTYESAFRGTLLFVISKKLIDRVSFKLSRRRADILISAALLRDAVEGKPDLESGDPPISFPLDVDSALALGYLACRSGGSAIMVVPGDPDSDSIKLMRDPRRNRSIDGCHLKVARFGKELFTKNDHNWVIDLSYLEALTLRRRFGAKRARLGFQSYSLVDFEKENDGSRGDYGYWSFNPVGECRYWGDSLFLRRTDRILLDDLAKKACEKIYGTLSEQNLTHLKAALLCALNMAQKLSHKNIEGRPVENCLFFPFADPSMKEFEESFTKLISPKELPKRMDFDYDESIDRFVEMADSLNLMIVSCLRHNEIVGIFQKKNAPWKGELHRQQLMQRAFEKVPALNGIFIYIHYKGRVEVYCSEPASGTCDDKRLFFFRENSTWEDPLYYKVRDVIKEGLPNLKDATHDKLLAVFLGLAESNESSLIVFLHQKDKDRFFEEINKLENPHVQNQLFEKTRREIEIHTPSVDDISVRNLMALFAVDGAHFILPDGKIKALGLRVLHGGSSVMSNSIQGGTGRAAAGVIQQLFKDSKVVKVSASGGIKV